MNEDKEVELLSVDFIKNKEYSCSDLRFIDVFIDVLHTGKNKKGTIYTKEVVDRCVDTIKNTPILGYIKEDCDGNIDFDNHNRKIVIEDNNIRYVFAGGVYGVVPESCNPRWITREDDLGIEREYLRVDAILWTKLEDSTDIMLRDGKKSHSMEVIQLEKEKLEDGSINVKDFIFDGCCILGEGVSPGMFDSSISLESYSSESLSSQIKQKLEEFSIVKSNENYSLSEKGAKMSKSEKENEGMVGIDTAKDVANTTNPIVPVEETVSNDTYSDESNKEEAFSETNEESYSLTAKQMEMEMASAVRNLEIIKREDFEYPRYWMRDIQDSEVIVYDNQDDNMYGFAFSMNGDNIVIDIATKKRKKTTYSDFDEGDPAVSASQSMLNEVVSTAAAMIKEMSAKVEEYNEIKPLYDEYVSKERKRKEEEEKQNRCSLFSIMDSKIGDDEEYVKLKNDETVSFSDLEVRCYAILGKKTVNFSYVPNQNSENSAVKFGVSGTQETSKKAYGGIVEKYVK